MIVTIQGVSESIQDLLMLLKVEYHCFFVLLVKSCFVSLLIFLKPLQKQMRVYLWVEYVCTNKVLIHVRFLTYCSVSPSCVFK